jgi:hypothetical protein
MSNNNNININLLNSRIIDCSDSQALDQFYFIGTGNNYIKKSDSSESINVNQSGNFYSNTNPIGKTFSDILDGGDSSRNASQFISPIIGGIDPVQRSGI